MDSHGKSSAQLEEEVEEQRARLEGDIDEIRRRLSPGQVLDEFLDYTKRSGGGEFVDNLSRSVRNNPLPVALTAIGLGWLMVRSNTAPAADADVTGAASGSYPYARIKGTALRRLRQATNDAGEGYSEFADETGARFRAASDEIGNRAGHFVDQAGTIYRGFTDEAGNRVSTFLDEAGSQLSDAQGWAADAWDSAAGRLGALQESASGAADELRRRASETGGRLQSNAGGFAGLAADLLRDQPLIGGAVAFAAGAMLASALPPTLQEDELVGEASDRMKEQGLRAAGDAYASGKQQLGDAFEQTREEASALYADLKKDLSAEQDTGEAH